MNYTLILIDRTKEYFDVIQQGLQNEKLTFFDGNGFPSFSKLVNAAIESAPTEIVIIMSYKVRPGPEHIYKILNLLNQGYGFVGLHEFRFFGVKKQLFRKIGLFDEGYATGGYEDDDLKIRMIENDIAFYLTTECPAIWKASTWDYNGSAPYFYSKWRCEYYPHTSKIQYIFRLIPESHQTTYNLGPEIPTEFLSHKQYSVACTDKVFPIMEATVVNNLDGFTTYVVSEDIKDYYKIKNLVGDDHHIEFFDCSDFISFSQAINTCVSNSPSDKIIFIFGSVLPTSDSITEIKNDINRGIGIVARCEFKFFGVNREVFKRVGIFDERFRGYEYSVYDYVLRCISNNIALIITHADIARNTSRNKIESLVYNDHKHWEAKWQFSTDEKIVKLLPEHFHNYKFNSTSQNLVDCASHSYTNMPWFGSFFHKIISK